MRSASLDADVIIVGGGPCGLVLAHELGRRGVGTILFNDRPETSPHPQANATQARTMEHYRRLGLATRIRAAGLPADYKPDVAYFTRFSAYELARFEQPSSAEVEALVRSMSGSWSAAELPHRCSQMYIERILREEAEKLSSVSLRFGCRVSRFQERIDGIEVEVELDGGGAETVRGRYLVGADGPRSLTRKQMGIRYEGERDTERPFLAGLMYSIYFKSTEFYKTIPHSVAWQYWAVNPERRGLMLALDGHSTFVYMTQLRPDERPEDLTEATARLIIDRAIGRSLNIEIIERSHWTAGLTLVAERFQSGRVFLGGDAVHLFTPTGGLGYNTAVDDAVNIGWKLAGVVAGWAEPEILDSYEAERKPVALRNTAFARMFADSLGRFTVPATIEADTDEGAAARDELGDYLNRHARAEFNIPGISLGARYDGSPLIVPDGSTPPPDDPSIYQPTACPGGRTPHVWLADGRSLYDALGFEFTLIRIGLPTQAVEPFLQAAEARHLPLTMLDLPDEGTRQIYRANFVLIRPDQIVCWRGAELPADPTSLFDRITGRGSKAPALDPSG